MAVSMMKDEAPFLLEWFAHHLAVGFTDILVYTNDCTDGTVEMLQRLEYLGLGHHRPNVIADGIKPQPSALNHAQAEPLVRDADWVMAFDADEFLSVNHPSGHLDGMLDDAVAQGANGIVITWRIFGSNEVVEWSRAPVTRQYTRAAPPMWHMGWGVKTLFKFDPEYWKLGIHRPSIKNKHLEDGFPDTVRWLNGSGQPMEDYFRFRGWRSIRRTVGFDWAQLNHYAVKSIDSYVIRKLRGNVNNKKDKYNVDYWSLQDRNEVADTRIQRHAAARDAIMAQLLADPVLRELHETALTRVEARLDEYRRSEAYQTLRADLIAAGQVPITQVEAKPPQARDPAKIAALMSRVERKTADDKAAARGTAPMMQPVGEGHDDPYATGRLRLSDDDGMQWIRNQEFELPADPQLFSPDAVMAILSGKFDRRHARSVATYAEGSRRLLDLGGGIGFCAMKAVRDCASLVVMLHDATPGMSAAAGAIHARNGMADSTVLKRVDGPLRLHGNSDDVATGLAAYLRDFRPDALRISPRAGLSPQILATAPLDGVARVILPMDSASQERGLRDSFGPILTQAGFAEDAEAAKNGSLLFRR